jgi:hypothetical protein
LVVCKDWSQIQKQNWSWWVAEILWIDRKPIPRGSPVYLLVAQIPEKGYLQ